MSDVADVSETLDISVDRSKVFEIVAGGGYHC
jgi:hypothetical protein